MTTAATPPPASAHHQMMMWNGTANHTPNNGFVNGVCDFNAIPYYELSAEEQDIIDDKINQLKQELIETINRILTINPG